MKDGIKRKYSINQLSRQEIAELEKFSYPDWFYKTRKAIPRGICLDCGKDTGNKRRRTCPPREYNVDGMKFKESYSRCNNSLYSSPYGMQGGSLRKALHKRDGFECRICKLRFSKTTKAGLELPMLWGEMDHIVPLAAGGTDDSYNIQIICTECHKDKTKNDMSEITNYKKINSSEQTTKE